MRSLSHNSPHSTGTYTQRRFICYRRNKWLFVHCVIRRKRNLITCVKTAPEHLVCAPIVCAGLSIRLTHVVNSALLLMGGMFVPGAVTTIRFTTNARCVVVTTVIITAQTGEVRNIMGDNYYIHVDNSGKSGRPPGGTLRGVMSLIIPGLGQLVSGYFGRAIGHFVLALLLWSIFLGWLIHIYSAYDASRVVLR